MSLKIKVCGMKKPDNVLEVAGLQPDMMGFIFYKKSPRAVEKGLAEWLAEQEEALQNIQRVGVFVNAEVDEVLNAVHDFRLDWVQLHGDESPGYCSLLQNVFDTTSMQKASIIKAFRVGEGFSFDSVMAFAAHADLFLFDTKGAAYGGTGQQFSWDILEKYSGNIPFLLSGGIGPEDVQKVQQFSHPALYGVDLNSRFESEPGVKDAAQLQTFFKKLSS